VVVRRQVFWDVAELALRGYGEIYRRAKTIGLVMNGRYVIA
jgi:hypothetical protein